jgi:Glyoxalase-like domain
LVLGTVVVAGLAASRQSRGSLDAGVLLGTGHGLDHVIVIVRDLEEASRTYSETLGFGLGTSGKLPGGIRNQLVSFGLTYLELMSIDAAQVDQQNEIVRLLKERGRLCIRPGRVLRSTDRGGSSRTEHRRRWSCRYRSLADGWDYEAAPAISTHVLHRIRAP